MPGFINLKLRAFLETYLKLQAPPRFWRQVKTGAGKTIVVGLRRRQRGKAPCTSATCAPPSLAKL